MQKSPQVCQRDITYIPPEIFDTDAFFLPTQQNVTATSQTLTAEGETTHKDAAEKQSSKTITTSSQNLAETANQTPS